MSTPLRTATSEGDAGQAFAGGARPAPALTGTAQATRRLTRLAQRRNLVPALSTGVILLTLVAAAAAPIIAAQDPTIGQLVDRLQPPGYANRLGASFPLGSDALGRDQLSRLIYGAQITMLVGIGSVLLSGTIGIIIGLVAGYFGGWVDRIVSVVSDIQMAFPFLCLAIALVAVLGTGITNIIVVLAVSGWVLYARIARGEVLRLRDAEFVQAARALGASDARILLKAILPNIWAPVIVVATFMFAQMVITEASLSFLGVGIQPPTPTWGGMLSDARQYIGVAWWLIVFPGAALLALVLAVNALGDWLRDVLDPRLKI